MFYFSICSKGSCIHLKLKFSLLQPYLSERIMFTFNLICIWCLNRRLCWSRAAACLSRGKPLPLLSTCSFSSSMWPMWISSLKGPSQRSRRLDPTHTGRMQESCTNVSHETSDKISDVFVSVGGDVCLQTRTYVSLQILLKFIQIYLCWIDCKSNKTVLREIPYSLNKEENSALEAKLLWNRAVFFVRLWWVDPWGELRGMIP